MTVQEVYETYGIEFANRTMDFPTGKKISKKISATNGSLFRFLNDWNSIYEIDEDLIPIVKNVIANKDAEEVLSSETEWVELNHDSTKIWYTGNTHDPDDPDFTIPTNHFMTIVIGWREFLSKEPLDGTKVKPGLFKFFGR